MGLRLAFIGTGQIAGWHLHGLAKLAEHFQQSEGPFDLVAIAEPRAEAAKPFAAEAQKALGRSPAIYADYRRMLETERLDAAALLVPHNLHWSIAKDCLDAGLHLQVQKPIALTIADGRNIIDYARAKERAMVVSEPSVLGRGGRALIAAMQDRFLGAPTMLLDYAVCTLGGGFFMGTPWRHLKGMAGAGWFLDHGVHRTHWFLEALGGVREAFATAKTFEPVRQDGKHGAFEVDTEDCAMSVLEFESGAVGHWMVASAGRGAGFGSVRVYTDQGVINLDARTVQRDGAEAVSWDDLVAPYADAAVPEDAMSHSFLELYEQIKFGKAPVASGERALEALAVVYACLEASTVGRPVTVADVLSGAANRYEQTIEAAREQWLAADPLCVS